MTRHTVSSGGRFEQVYGYSRAVRVGDHVHVAGTTATDPDIDGADTYRQARAALAIIQRALQEAGSSLAAVARTVTYVTDIDDLELVAKAPITQQVCDRAIDIQAALADKAKHRGASIPDLLIAACAEHHGAVVLHYGSDFDLVATVTGQPMQWVVPRGSLD